MEDYYIMEAMGKKFVVVFTSNVINIPDFRKFTHCTIIEEPGKSVYAGATIRNPNDERNTWIARRWSFKRAVMEIYLVWNELKKTNMCYTSFWQQFRLGLAKNELYLKDRKENKNE